MRSKSFSNKINYLVSSLTLVACMTTYDAKEFAPYRKHAGWTTNYPDKDVSTPKEFQNLWCKNGKQVRSLQKTIRGVIPRAPSGIPVEKAARRNKILFGKLKDYVKNYYFFTANPGSEYFTGLPFYELEKIEAYFKNAETRDLEPDAILERSESGGDDLAATGVFVDFEDKKKPTLLGLRGLPVFKIYTGYAQTSNAVTIAGKLESTSGSVMVRPDSARTFQISANLDSHGAFKGRSKDKTPYYPMKPVAPLEWNYLRSSFTLLVPEEAQANVFGNELVEKIRQQRKSKGAFIKLDGTFDTTDAVNPRSLQTLWNIYLQKWTSVTESETQDPQVVLYQVSLDLNPFCAYGRPIADFVTK